MKGRRMWAVACGLVAFLVAAIPSARAQYSHLVVFGDSLSDTGNFFLATQGLLPAAPYDRGRFSNGPLYADLLAEELGLSLEPSLEGGLNYAVAGATTRSHELGPAFSLQSQVSGFLLASENVPPDALYVLFIGANDVRGALEEAAGDPVNGMAAAEQMVTLALQDIDQAVRDLAGAGVTHLVVPNLPDLGKTPVVMEMDGSSPGASALASALTATFNNGLQGIVKSWQEQIHVMSLDVFGLLNEVLANPGAFGFANVVSPCYTGGDPVTLGGGSVCAAPDQYLFWDDFHPTAAAHAVIARRMAALVTPVEPCLTAGGAAEGDSVEIDIDTASCEAFVLRLSLQVEEEEDGAQGRIFVGLESPDAFPGQVFFRPADSNTPPYLVAGKTDGGFAPGASESYYSRGELDAQAEDAVFTLGGIRGLAGRTVVFTSWALAEGLELTDENLEKLQEVRVELN